MRASTYAAIRSSLTIDSSSRFISSTSPLLYECANLANIRCQASLVGTDGFAICLDDCNGVYKVDAFRELDIDERDSTLDSKISYSCWTEMVINSTVTMHCIEPIVTYALPEFKDILRLKGMYKVRFEVVWVQKRGCLKEKRVIYTVDTSAIELWYEVNKGKSEPGAPGLMVKPSWKGR